MISKSVSVAVRLVASSVFALGFVVATPFWPGKVEVSQAHASGHNGRVTWQSSLTAGSDLAKQEHKYVLADVYTDWCHWCKKLDKDVFPDSALAGYLQKDFICVKVNAEDPREGARVARAYKVNGFPCLLVFSPEGRLLGRVPGYMNARNLTATLQHLTGQDSQGQSMTGQQDQQQLPANVQQQPQYQQQQQNPQQQLQQLDQLQKQWQQQNQQQPQYQQQQQPQYQQQQQQPQYQQQQQPQYQPQQQQPQYQQQQP